MLNSKQRILLILISMTVLLIPFAINQLAINLDLKINPRDVKLYQETNTVEYIYQNGSLGHSAKLTLDINVPDTKDTATVTVTVDGVQSKYQCDYDNGYWIDDGILTSNYTIFWIFTKNPMLHGWDFERFKNTTVVDPLGIIGPVNETYLLVIGEKKVYWDVYPDMDGAQFSFVIRIYNSNNVKVAEGLMDSTSGLLEILEGGPNNTRIEVVSPGNFKISRNRYIILTGGIILTAALPIAMYLIMRWRKREKSEAEEFSLLLAVGASAVVIDIDIDVWFYARFDFWGMLGLHFITLIIYGLVCMRLRYGIKWCILGLTEILFVLVIVWWVGDPYVPHITAFMGLTVTFWAMLFRSGIDKKEYDDTLDFLF